MPTLRNVKCSYPAVFTIINTQHEHIDIQTNATKCMSRAVGKPQPPPPNLLSKKKNRFLCCRCAGTLRQIILQKKNMSPLCKTSLLTEMQSMPPEIHYPTICTFFTHCICFEFKHYGNKPKGFSLPSAVHGHCPPPPVKKKFQNDMFGLSLTPFMSNKKKENKTESSEF